MLAFNKLITGAGSGGELRLVQVHLGCKEAKVSHNILKGFSVLGGLVAIAGGLMCCTMGTGIADVEVIWGLELGNAMGLTTGSLDIVW